jgi:hypothetical protein
MSALQEQLAAYKTDGRATSAILANNRFIRYFEVT